MALFARTLSFLFFVCLFFPVVAAEDQNLKKIGFKSISNGQQSLVGSKVEVVEFFAYECPHCSRLEGVLNEWVKKQGDRISFRRIHVHFSDMMEAQQRLYFALELMNRENEDRHRIFDQIHQKHVGINSDEDVLKFVQENNIDKQKFLLAYSSIQVREKVRKAIEMQRVSMVHSVPAIVVDRRFLTNPDLFENHVPSSPLTAWWSRLIGSSVSEPRSEIALQQDMLAALDAMVDSQIKLHK
jgi:thiol:disulfide interchange protein DsbA